MLTYTYRGYTIKIKPTEGGHSVIVTGYCQPFYEFRAEGTPDQLLDEYIERIQAKLDSL